MEGSPHKHKRTIAQDFLTKSLSQSIELNLSLNRYSFSTEHSGPLTLRVTHHSGPEDTPASPGCQMKKSSIQERPASRTISNLRSNLLQLEQKLSQAQRQLNTPTRSPSPGRPTNRSTVGSQPFEFERMLGLFVCNQVSEDESTINLESQKLLGVKSRDKLALTHHAHRYYTAHALRALTGHAPAAAQHLAAAIAAMKQAMILRVPSQVEVQGRRVTLSCVPQPGRKTLLLELEATLLSVRPQREHEDDLEIGPSTARLYVALRPYLFSFLKKLKQYFELVVFTSLEGATARQILQDIDPERKLLSDCLSRQHCLPLKGGLLCKDIRIINRSPKDTCLVDANPAGAQLQPDNCIPILPWRGGEDRELMELEKYLVKEVSSARDVREALRERFKLNRYWQFEGWEGLVRELYLD